MKWKKRDEVNWHTKSFYYTYQRFTQSQYKNYKNYTKYYKL